MDEIQKFVDDARQKGWEDDRTREALLANGWSAPQVDAALSGLSVPKPPSASEGVAPVHHDNPPHHEPGRPSINALQAALQHVLLWVFTLTSSIMIGIVSFALFGNRSDGSSETLLTYVVLELVTFAPFAFLFWRYLLRMGREPELMTGKVWSIITIVLHSIGLIASVIAFILVIILVHDNATLAGLVASGTIGTMNALVVLAYALANFTKAPQSRFRRSYLLAFPYLLFILIGVLGVFAMLRVGPLRADDQTRQNLTTTVQKIHEYAGEHKSLPNNLSQVSGAPAGVTYKNLGTYTYQVCANFKKKYNPEYTVSTDAQDDSYADKWAFQYGKAGNNCWKFLNADLQKQAQPAATTSTPQICSGLAYQSTTCVTD